MELTDKERAERWSPKLSFAMPMEKSAMEAQLADPNVDTEIKIALARAALELAAGADYISIMVGHMEVGRHYRNGRQWTPDRGWTKT